MKTRSIARSGERTFSKSGRMKETYATRAISATSENSLILLSPMRLPLQIGRHEVLFPINRKNL